MSSYLSFLGSNLTAIDTFVSLHNNKHFREFMININSTSFGDALFDFVSRALYKLCDTDVMKIIASDDFKTLFNTSELTMIDKFKYLTGKIGANLHTTYSPLTRDIVEIDKRTLITLLLQSIVQEEELNEIKTDIELYNLIIAHYSGIICGVITGFLENVGDELDNNKKTEIINNMCDYLIHVNNIFKYEPIDNNEIPPSPPSPPSSPSHNIDEQTEQKQQQPENKKRKLDTPDEEERTTKKAKKQDKKK